MADTDIQNGITMTAKPSKKSLRGRAARTFVLLTFGLTICHGYTIVVVSTGAPTGIESQMIAAMANQFNIKVVPNPLASNTYAITLYGTNPNFNPPVSQADLLKQIDLDAQYMATVDTSTFIYGFADGMSYQQRQEENTVGSYAINCSTPTLFNLLQTSTSTFDKNTCSDVLGTINYQLYEQSLSTPTVIPPEN